MISRASRTLSSIPEFLEQLRQERFYGRVSFDLRDGAIVLIRTERTQLVDSRLQLSIYQGKTRNEHELTTHGK